MKPIPEMTLQECLASIRRGDYLNRHHLADRIQSLTRWIPVEERLPTKEDADDFGFVQWFSVEHGVEKMEWGSFYPVRKSHTHWRRIDTP